MRTGLLTLTSILLAVSALAAEDGGEQTYRSFLSQTSCAQMVSGLQDKSAQKEFSVMVGAFITGTNYAKGRDSQIDVKGMLLITEQFCRQNPQRPVSAALITLDRAIDRQLELIKKQE